MEPANPPRPGRWGSLQSNVSNVSNVTCSTVTSLQSNHTQSSRASTPRPDPNRPIDQWYPLYMDYISDQISIIKDGSHPDDDTYPILMGDLHERWDDILLVCKNAFLDNLTCPLCSDRPDTLRSSANTSNASTRHAYSVELQAEYDTLIREMEGCDLMALTQVVMEEFRLRFFNLEDRFMNENTNTQCRGLVDRENRHPFNYGEVGPPGGRELHGFWGAVE